MKKETAYQRRGCSIFCKILHSLLLVLLAEVLLLIFAISTSRVTSQLNENAEDILDKQVENRANYLRQNLIQAQDLNAISGTIDGVTRELVDQGVVDLNTLDTSSEEALPLLQAIVPELVSTLRTKPVNGIFVILSTHDLNHRADDSYLPGLYIRDLDSSALSTDRNADLLAERGPATAFAPLGISTDKGWSPAMPYQPGGKTSFYKESFQIAYAFQEQAFCGGLWPLDSYNVLPERGRPGRAGLCAAPHPGRRHRVRCGGRGAADQLPDHPDAQQ